MAREAQRRVRKAPEIRRRLGHGQREQRILSEAARFFAEAGLDGRTRDLARRMGVSQALIYRYFPNKEQLIDGVYDHVFAERWDSGWEDILRDRSVDLADRLIRFYTAYAGRFSFVSLRLFMLAGLTDRRLAERVSFPLTERILKPVIEELRAVAGMPPCSEMPMTRGERELAMMLHGGIVFIGIRKFVYRMPIPDDFDDLIELHVRAFLGRAEDVVKALARNDSPDSLNVQLLR